MASQFREVGPSLRGLQEIGKSRVEEPPSVGERPAVGRIEIELMAELPLLLGLSGIVYDGQNAGLCQFPELRGAAVAVAQGRQQRLREARADHGRNFQRVPL